MKKTILIADDDKEEIEELRIVLNQYYNVISFPDGFRAFQRIKEGGIDGVVLNWQMTIYNQNELKLSTEDERYAIDPSWLSEQYYGDKVSVKLREQGFEGPIILYSLIARRFKTELEPYDVYCYEIGEEEYLGKIVEYFQDKLKQ